MTMSPRTEAAHAAARALMATNPLPREVCLFDWLAEHDDLSAEARIAAQAILRMIQECEEADRRREAAFAAAEAEAHGLAAPLQTPAEDATTEALGEWHEQLTFKQAARLASQLLMGLTCPENGKPSMEGAQIIADAMGPDYTLSLAQLAAEIHKRA